MLNHLNLKGKIALLRKFHGMMLSSFALAYPHIPKDLTVYRVKLNGNTLVVLELRLHFTLVRQSPTDLANYRGTDNEDINGQVPMVKVRKGFTARRQRL
jgi:hypothetical protein